MSIRARPPAREPVKPTALMPELATRAEPSSMPESKTIEKVPSGILHSATAAWMALATISAVPAWAAWARTMTGHPAARALAVSPPATEKARGKWEAQNTATGPRGRRIDRRSGLGMGERSGFAISMRASTHDPSSMRSANMLSCPTVRPRSPSQRASGSPDSAIMRGVISGPASLIFSEMVRRNLARILESILE